MWHQCKFGSLTGVFQLVELKNFWKQVATFPAAARRMSVCHCDHCVQSPLNWIVHWIGYLFMVYHWTCTELITIDSQRQRSWRNGWEKFKQEAIWIDVLFWSPARQLFCQIVLSWQWLPKVITWFTLFMEDRPARRAEICHFEMPKHLKTTTFVF